MPVRDIQLTPQKIHAGAYKQREVSPHEDPWGAAESCTRHPVLVEARKKCNDGRHDECRALCLQVLQEEDINEAPLRLALAWAMCAYTEGTRNMAERTLVELRKLILTMDHDEWPGAVEIFEHLHQLAFRRAQSLPPDS